MGHGLEAISDAVWENLGILIGGIACTTIGYQILHEWRTPGPSSVSVWFVGGFFCVYVFWFLYGVRFRRRGIWLPNAAAAVLQVVFAIIVLVKG